MEITGEHHMQRKC